MAIDIDGGEGPAVVITSGLATQELSDLRLPELQRGGLPTCGHLSPSEIQGFLFLRDRGVFEIELANPCTEVGMTG